MQIVDRFSGQLISMRFVFTRINLNTHWVVLVIVTGACLVNKMNTILYMYVVFFFKLIWIVSMCVCDRDSVCVCVSVLGVLSVARRGMDMDTTHCDMFLSFFRVFVDNIFRWENELICPERTPNCAVSRGWRVSEFYDVMPFFLDRIKM